MAKKKSRNGNFILATPARRNRVRNLAAVQDQACALCREPLNLTNVLANYFPSILKLLDEDKNQHVDRVVCRICVEQVYSGNFSVEESKVLRLLDPDKGVRIEIWKEFGISFHKGHVVKKKRVVGTSQLEFGISLPYRTVSDIDRRLGVLNSGLRDFLRGKIEKDLRKKEKIFVRYRRILHEMQDGRCFYCNRKTVIEEKPSMQGFPLCATIDHIVPSAKGGENTFSNYVLACADCNQKKGVMNIRDFMRQMLEWHGTEKEIEEFRENSLISA